MTTALADDGTPTLVAPDARRVPVVLYAGGPGGLLILAEDSDAYVPLAERAEGHGLASMVVEGGGAAGDEAIAEAAFGALVDLAIERVVLVADGAWQRAAIALAAARQPRGLVLLAPCDGALEERERELLRMPKLMLVGSEDACAADAARVLQRRFIGHRGVRWYPTAGTGGQLLGGPFGAHLADAVIELAAAVCGIAGAGQVQGTGARRPGGGRTA